MFETVAIDGHNTILSNGNFDVKISPKIYGGYTLIKTVKDNPLEIIEIRDIRLPLSEKEIIKEAKNLLKQSYESVDFNHYNIQTI
ncbi:MAG: hypothetical protein RR614_01295 [Eubacterium sp.]